MPIDKEFATWQVLAMTLSEFLHTNSLKPSAFAAQIGVAPSTITRLLNGERSPRLDLVARIQAGTEGKVTAADFMAAQESAA